IRVGIQDSRSQYPEKSERRGSRQSPVPRLRRFAENRSRHWRISQISERVRSRLTPLLFTRSNELVRLSILSSVVLPTESVTKTLSPGLTRTCSCSNEVAF